MAKRISQRSLSDEGFVDDSEEEESTQAPEAKEAEEAEQEPTEEGEEDSEEQTEPLTPSLVGQKLSRFLRLCKATHKARFGIGTGIKYRCDGMT
jgi:hypothetical protein